MTDLAQEPEVRRWFASAGYDADGRGEERHQLLSELEAFCDYTGKSAGELVRSCLRTTKTGETAISTKGRSAIQDVIESFVAEQGLSGHAAIVTANHIRGFLIHNGIFMQGRPSIS
jgi:hypothetical protein